MAETHGHLESDVFYDFEAMSCGDLLIALMKAMRPLPSGSRVEVRALDPGVAAAVRVGADPKALDEADAVVAQGSDETIASIRARVPPARPFIGYGHKLSLALIGTDVDPATAARSHSKRPWSLNT